MDIKTFLNFDQAYFYNWILGSFICCMLVHHWISPKLFGAYCESYKKLKKNKQMEWDSRIVSTIHALVVSLMSLCALIFERQIWSNRISYASPTGSRALSITVGYFMCDIISMPMYWRGKSLIIFFIHHTFSAGAFLYAINIQSCIFFCIIRLTSELSTPFTNQRWIYLTSGLTHGHKRVVYSTLAFAILFSIVRNWIIAPYWIMVYLDYNSEAHRQSKSVNQYLDYVWLGCAGILDILNIYWGPGVYRSGRRAFQAVHPTFSLKSLKYLYNSDDDDENNSDSSDQTKLEKQNSNHSFSKID